jgi:hypothetical protein
LSQLWSRYAQKAIGRSTGRWLLLALGVALVFGAVGFAVVPKSQASTACPWNSPPKLLSFEVYYSYNSTWIAHGWVEDEDPMTCTIALGGMIGTHTVLVNPSGEFYYVLHLTSENAGLATARATDSGGRLSNILEDFVVF